MTIFLCHHNRRTNYLQTPIGTETGDEESITLKPPPLPSPRHSEGEKAPGGGASLRRWLAPTSTISLSCVYGLCIRSFFK